MRFWALFVIPLVVVVGTSRAQPTSNPATGAPRNAPGPQSSGQSLSQFSGQSTGHVPDQAADQDTAKAPMTPRQRAEVRGDILVARKEYALAAKAYEDILQQDPRNAPLLNKIGICYQQLGDISRARRYYKRATGADKKFGSAINNLGTLEYMEKHYGKAIKYFKKALLLKGDQSGVYSNLGYAYCGNREYPRAMEAFSKALALDPEVFEHKGGMGPIVQQRSADDPGALYFVVARSFAKAGDAEHTARYLKLARDLGYKGFGSVPKDPDFARVIKDPRVQEVLRYQPPYAPNPDGAAPN